MNGVQQIARDAKEASAALAVADGPVIRRAVEAMSRAVLQDAREILSANELDVQSAVKGGLGGALLDRLRLGLPRIQGMADGLAAVANQPGVIGEIIQEWTRPNGLQIRKVRVPLGVVAVIYEARPNVTADVSGLCLKSGNAAVLRGSSHAIESNRAITHSLRRAIEDAGLPANSVQLIEDTSREAAVELMQLKGYIDLIIPRGGPNLIRTIEENSRVPYIIDGDGNCHVYIDRSADLDMAHDIVMNAKTSRPGVCNAAETLLLHRELPDTWICSMLNDLSAEGVEIRGDERIVELWPKSMAASEEDWATEYLDLILAVKVVESVDEAIAHVNRYGTSNAEAVVAQDRLVSERFVKEVDSGTIFVNSSTRFSDGGEFGFGAEIGISTQKLHARGPMGSAELTTYKYIVEGDGQVRT